MRGQTDPFEQMEAMFEQMRRSAFGSLPAQGRPSGARFERPDSGARFERPDSGTPALGPRDTALTVEETDDGYRVVADLPGFERDEIDLTFDDGVLTIDGAHEETSDEAYRQRAVSESVRIPGDVAMDDVSATYRNGVLEVVLPASEPGSEGHRIDIE